MDWEKFLARNNDTNITRETHEIALRYIKGDSQAKEDVKKIEIHGKHKYHYYHGK